MTEDKRPDPKPRKNIKLWQAYLMWDELVEMRKRHLLRISSIESGKSNMDLDLEYRFLELMRLDDRVDDAKSYMIEYGEEVGEIWEWVTSIKGLGSGSLAARLLAHIDDIGKFATVSKLWRFAGLAVIDGKADEAIWARAKAQGSFELSRQSTYIKHDKKVHKKPDPTTSFKVTWDDKTLYLFISHFMVM